MDSDSSVFVSPGGQRILAVLAHPDDGESLSGNVTEIQQHFGFFQVFIHIFEAIPKCL